ncbi:MAG: hypothetical protein EOO15_06425 [Chitinophagaceae bacterium]|nr:MAG: hypothetical protein EOO15_06425 [Chitinophagaceae bacterium]
MIWWRGNGLWLGFIASIPVFVMTTLGATHFAPAYAGSAAVIYMMRGAIGAESALFSISTRFWPPLLLVIALIVQFSPPGRPPKGSKEAAIADLQFALPRVLGDKLRLDQAKLEGSTLQYAAKALVPLDSDGTQQADVRKAALKHYCEDLKALWQSKINVTFTMTIPPKTLNDRVTAQSISLQPSECQ